MNNNNWKWFYILISALLIVSVSLGVSVGVILSQRKPITQEVSIVNETIKPNTTNNKININTASSKILMDLPTIGEKKATEIINYRNKNGNFKNINDLKNVSGITDNTIQSILNLITVEGE